MTFALEGHTHLRHTQSLACWGICSLRHMFAASLYLTGTDQVGVGHTSAKGRCCRDDLAELIRRRGFGLMFFLLLMSCKSMFNLSLCHCVFIFWLVLAPFIYLVLNTLSFHSRAYIAQVASQGKLLMWGAKVCVLFRLSISVTWCWFFYLIQLWPYVVWWKINSLIDRGQFWRLATSSLLHANVTHLAVCFHCSWVHILWKKMLMLISYLLSQWCSSIVSLWTQLGRWLKC